MKICLDCKEEKPDDKFYWSKTHNSLTSYCKTCLGVRQREYQSRNRTRINARLRAKYARDPGPSRKSMLKALYNITPVEWDQMFSAQGSRCGLCSATSPRSKLGWCTDHCHDTGRVRGILCRSCNIALGGYERVARFGRDRVEAYLNPPTCGTKTDLTAVDGH